MKAVPQEQFVVKRDAEWEAISSAVRLEILVVLMTGGPCAIRNLAEMMDRPADGLYHHIRKLLSAGLICEYDTRKVGKQTEVIYQSVAKDLTIDPDITKKRTKDRVLRLFQTILLQAQRTLAAAIGSETAILDGQKKNMKLHWMVSWLNDRQLAKVQMHQEAINKILQDGLQKGEGNQFAVLTYLSPVTRTRHSEKSTTP